MKKILTFLVMLLISGSTLMAQNEQQEVQMPKFRYQAVLRDANNMLVANQSGTVDISIKDRSNWVVEEPFTTNANGLVSLELDFGRLDGPQGFIWNGDTLTAKFTLEDGTTITLNTPVTAVPYALQAGDVRITTPMLTDYFERAVPEDVDRVYQALLDNPTFSQACRDSAVHYIMAKYRIAKGIAYAYLDSLTQADVKAAYDTMHNIDPSVKHAFYDIIKDYLKNHRSLLLEVAEYYISTATTEEAEELYASFETSSAATAVRNILKDYFEQYLRGKGLICNSNMTLCDAAEAVASNTLCPEFENNGIVGTQYGTLQGTSITDVDSIVVTVNVQNIDPDHFNIEDVTVLVLINYSEGEQYPVERELQADYVSGNLFKLKIVPTSPANYVEGYDQNNFKVKLKKSGCQDKISGSQPFHKQQL